MNCSFTDKDRATDLLNTEKHLASCYGSQLLEAATPEVVACLKELQGSTYSMQEQLFAEMNSRGWYPVAKAEEQKLNQTKMKYSVPVSQ